MPRLRKWSVLLAGKIDHLIAVFRGMADGLALA
jgi:hypothetical protein